MEIRRCVRNFYPACVIPHGKDEHRQCEQNFNENPAFFFRQFLLHAFLLFLPQIHGAYGIVYMKSLKSEIFDFACHAFNEPASFFLGNIFPQTYHSHAGRKADAYFFHFRHFGNHFFDTG